MSAALKAAAVIEYEKQIARHTKLPEEMPVIPEMAKDYTRMFFGTRSLSEIMYERRTELGMSASDLARALNIKSSEFIGMVERGRRNLELNRVPMLADALKLDSEALCRLALFEAAPQIAMRLFGRKINDFDPKPDKTGKIASKITPEQLEFNNKLYSLPSPLRVTVLHLIDQFFTLVNNGPTRLSSISMSKTTEE